MAGPPTTTLIGFSEDLNTDSALRQEFEANPIQTLEKKAAESKDAVYNQDKTFWYIVIGGLLGIIILVILVQLVLQVGRYGSVPDWMSSIAAISAGGIIGLFAKSPTQ